MIRNRVARRGARLLVGLCSLALAWTTTSEAAALGKELVISVQTDKAVYNTTEPVRVQVNSTNPTDTSWYIAWECLNSITQSCDAHVNVLDLATKRPVWQGPAGTRSPFLFQVIVPHATQAMAVADIPANVLAPGKKYEILIDFRIKLRPNGSATEVFFTTNATTVISVR